MSKYFKFFYEGFIIDFFEAFKPFKDYLQDIRERELVSQTEEQALKLLMEACYIATKYGCWEGDIIAGPFVVGLPLDNYNAETLILFKQSNNGYGFLLSPIELTYLKDYETKFK